MGGQVVRINSGFRCREYNERVGGSPTSAHLTGEAADLRCIDSTARHKLAGLAHENFARVGIAFTFIHIDISTAGDKDQDVTWLYPVAEREKE